MAGQGDLMFFNAIVKIILNRFGNQIKRQDEDRLITLFAAILALPLLAANPKGYDIKISVKSLGNTKLILAYYYGDKQYVKDTFRMDETGTCHIKAREHHPSCRYLSGSISSSRKQILRICSR
jgi:hypothetical protein